MQRSFGKDCAHRLRTHRSPPRDFSRAARISRSRFTNAVRTCGESLVSAGRSINLAISTRGIHALREAGLWDSMRSIIVPMRGRMMHSVAGELTFQPYGKDETEVINSISRADLNAALMDAAEAQGVAIRFSERCIGIGFANWRRAVPQRRDRTRDYRRFRNCDRRGRGCLGHSR